MKINDVLFIPKKGKVGFVYRENSANGKMSYITYFDEKGKLRKEISFEKWRDHNIGTTIFENIPTSGFKLLDNDKIYSTGYFGGEDHEKLIMFDPRGFEFSISVDNFVYLCSHGSLIDMEFKNVEFVYAWDKLQLVLLPSNSSIYRKNMEKLKLVNNKIKETEMLPGASYSFKKEDEKLIYIGKYYYVNYDSYENSDGRFSKFEENQVYLKNILMTPRPTRFRRAEDKGSYICLTFSRLTAPKAGIKVL